MSVKLLVSGAAASGKTTLLSSLEDVLIIAIDGKKYPFKQAHRNIAAFDVMDDLTNNINEAIVAYKDKKGEFPKTIAIDSVSRVFEITANNCNRKLTGFNVYSELNKEVAKFTAYIEDVLIANGLNVVIVSHTIYNQDTMKHDLVAQGSFAKLGGFLSIVDNAVFIETKANKRIVHNRSIKFPARTILADLKDSVPSDEYDIQEHIHKLEKVKDEVAEFII